MTGWSTGLAGGFAQVGKGLVQKFHASSHHDAVQELGTKGPQGVTSQSFHQEDNLVGYQLLVIDQKLRPVRGGEGLDPFERPPDQFIDQTINVIFFSRAYHPFRIEVERPAAAPRGIALVGVMRLLMSSQPEMASRTSTEEVAMSRSYHLKRITP